MKNKTAVGKVNFPCSVKRGSVEVKIYRALRGSSETFTVSHYQDGTRKRAKFAEFGKAKTHAENTAVKLASTDNSTLQLTGADLQAYRRARQILDRINVPIEVAATNFAYAQEKLGGPGIFVACKVSSRAYGFW